MILNHKKLLSLTTSIIDDLEYNSKLKDIEISIPFYQDYLTYGCSMLGGVVDMFEYRMSHESPAIIVAQKIINN